MAPESFWLLLQDIQSPRYHAPALMVSIIWKYIFDFCEDS